MIYDSLEFYEIYKDRIKELHSTANRNPVHPARQNKTAKRKLNLIEATGRLLQIFGKKLIYLGRRLTEYSALHQHMDSEVF